MINYLLSKAPNFVQIGSSDFVKILPAYGKNICYGIINSIKTSNVSNRKGNMKELKRKI